MAMMDELLAKTLPPVEKKVDNAKPKLSDVADRYPFCMHSASISQRFSTWCLESARNDWLSCHRASASLVVRSRLKSCRGDLQWSGAYALMLYL